jgi:hypothetical protein
MADLERRPGYNLDAQIKKLVEASLSSRIPDVAYMARLLLHSAFPHSATDEQVIERKNGGVSVMIQAGPRMKLPYGTYPRLILAWIITEANRTGSRTLRLGDNLNDFMKQLGLVPTGGRWGSITKLKEQMRRLLQARIVAEFDSEVLAKGVSMELGVEWNLWWKSPDGDGGEIPDSYIELGERFFQEITHRPFPVRLDILRAIKRSPLGIDLYCWLTYRVSYLREPVFISWKQLHQQFGADYGNVDEFARKAKREIAKIKLAWPELHYETPRGRLALYPSPPSVPRKLT